MKKFILAASILTMLLSCKKETVAPQVQTVDYDVKCNYCSVYIEDNVWNRYNEQERSKNQHFNVNGTWHYEFKNEGLDAASLRVFLGSFGGVQHIEASITTNDKRKVILSRDMGFGSKSDLIDTAIYLNLK